MTDQTGAAGGVAPADAGDIAAAAARGAAVTLSGQAVRIALQFAGVIVLARLLRPHDYGLFAVVVVVVGIGEIFRDFGLANAAVQAKTLSTAQRDGLLWINAAIGVVLTGLAIGIAPLVALAFDEDALLPMVQASAVTFAFNGLATQYRADLARRMRFGQLVGCDIAGQAIGLTLGIVLAAAGAGYWALVAQLAGQAAGTLVALIPVAGWLPGRPRRGAGLGPFLHFGKNLAFSTVVNYLSNNVDTITIALRLGPTPLGVYNRGFSLLMSPLNQFRSPATTVALPVLSRLQDDHARAGEYLKRGQLVFGYTVCAGLAIVAGGAEPIVQLVLGGRWAAVAPVLRFLAIAGASTMLAFVGFWVYVSRGLGAQLLRYTMVTAVLQAACVIGGSWWGVNGVAAGFMIAAIVEWPLSLVWLSRRTVIPLADLLRGAGRISVCGAAAGAAAWAVTQLPADHAAPANVGLCVAAGVAVYALAAGLVPAVRRDLRAVAQVAGRMAHRTR